MPNVRVPGLDIAVDTLVLDAFVATGIAAGPGGARGERERVLARLRLRRDRPGLLRGRPGRRTGREGSGPGRRYRRQERTPPN